MANQFKNMGMPVTNQEAAQTAEAARQIGLQAQMQQMGQQSPVVGPAVAQQMGAQQAAASGAIQTAAMAGEAQKSVEQAKREFEQQKIADQERDVVRRESLDRRRMEQESNLNKLGRDTKAKLVDQRREFESDARGEKFKSQRQMADFMVAMAADEEAFNTYAQETEQAMQADMEMMRQAYNILSAEEERMFKSGESERDRESYNRIQAHKEELARQARKAKKKAGTFKKMIGAAKVIGGALAAPMTGGATAGIAVSGAQDIAMAD